MKFLQKDTQITWTVDDLLKEGFIKVGSKTYEEYWKYTKTDDILTLSVVDDNYEVKEIVLTKVKEMSYNIVEEILKAKPALAEEFKHNIKEKLDELRKCSK